MIIRPNQVRIQDRARTGLLAWNHGVRGEPYLLAAARDQAVKVLRRCKRRDLRNGLGVHDACHVGLRIEAVIRPTRRHG